MPLSPEDPSTFSALVCACLAASIGALGVWLWRRVRGTTLSAPAAWLVVVAAFCAAVEAALAWRGDPEGALGASLARYAAAAGTCCPLVAVLGAKRPQDRGWQWVVLSLWVILLVPAGQTWAAHSGGSQLELALLWRVLLVALVALGLLNYVPTRHGLVAAGVALSQLELLRPYVLDMPAADHAHRRMAAFVALALAAVIATLVGRTARQRVMNQTGAPSDLERFTHRWLAFRNGWGAFWGLRVLQRVNETAELSGWPVRLAWSGFITPSSVSEPPPEIDDRIAAHINQTLDTLLRRFERLHKPSPPGTPT